MNYGYARVSAKDQSLARQLDALRELGLSDDMIFTDKASGKDFNRPSYRRLMRRLKPGDVIFVKSIDRLGRNYQEIIEEWRSITQKKGAHIVVLDMPLLDTRNDKGGDHERLHHRRGASAPLLCRSSGAREHQAKTSRGHRIRKGTRRQIRKTQDRTTRDLSKDETRL